jgi:hypothetical protein
MRGTQIKFLFSQNETGSSQLGMSTVGAGHAVQRYKRKIMKNTSLRKESKENSKLEELIGKDEVICIKKVDFNQKRTKKRDEILTSPKNGSNLKNKNYRSNLDIYSDDGHKKSIGVGTTTGVV